ncbi:hypothetical protein ESZ50_00765 [Weissella muntiaci]|uniref:Uncharacterized protein n=1 Tax=Weissella muntiaci TaxID=2508881 RepID=A0A6C2CC43_9LACO|nr:hypothetical protein [Weissella muntiaci]TYC51099.1 hypothetical protein ESZ50_00765 [Weissella muntiaci]
MKPGDNVKKKLIVNLIAVMLGTLVFYAAMNLIISIIDDYSVTSKATEKVRVIQVDKNQSLFGTSVAYIVDDPEGNDRISVTETDSYARYKAGDEIQLKITKFKNAPTDIDLKN